MKKLILSLAVLFASSTAVVSYAQTQNPAPVQNEKAAKKEGKDFKGERKEGKKGPHRMQPIGMNDPFDGLELTEQQRTQLSSLQQTARSERGEQKGEMKDLSDEQKKELRAQRANEKVQMKRNYLNGVKSILKPDQYIIFLENFYIQNEPQNNMGQNRPHSKKDKMKRPEKVIKNAE